jgi:hypothetical protein
MSYAWKLTAIAARTTRMSAGLLALLGVALMAAIPASATPGPAATTTTLTVQAGGNSVTTVTWGTAVTLTASVLAGSTPVTSGTVNFCDATAAYCEDIHLLGTAQLTSAGTATLHMVPGIAVHNIKAVFAGTTAATSSSSAASSLTVNGYGPTTTAFQSSGSAGNYTLTGTLTAFGIATPSGHMLFENQSNNNALAATSALDSSTLVSGFAPLQTYGTGTNPYSIAIGDFRGIGILDLAVANNSDGNVSVLLGKGDGTFASAKDYKVGSSPYAVAMGDFNGDGIPDLVAANFGDDTVTVLLGVGDGTFLPQTPVAAGSMPSAVAVGDFNNDGFLDIAVADYSGGSGSVSILLGNGNGTFQAAKSTAVGNSPYGIAVADFNGDGLLDVVTANYGSENASVLIGNGDGTFQTAVPYAVASGGSNAYGVAVGDFNADGFPDIALASTGNVSVLINKGTGLFNPAVGYSAGSGVYAIAVGDFNLDGKADLAAANVNSQNLSVLPGAGDGTFGSPINTPAGGTPQGVAVGDYNGDGRPDLAAAVTGASNYAGVLLGEQTESATATGVNILGTGPQNVFASYSSDPNYNASVSTITSLTGTGVSTSLSVVATPNPASFGQAPSVIATLTPSNATGITAGSFTAFLDVTTLLNITAKGGNQFQITGAALSNLTLGAHSIVVNFLGASDDLPSNGSTSLQINQATPTLKWNPPAAVSFGASLVSVLSASAQNGTVGVVGSYTYTATPSGGTPSPITGTAILLPGIYTISVTFTPTDAIDYQSVSGSVALTVNQGKPTVALTSSMNPVFLGSAVTFTANVSSNASTPTGSVSFVDGQTLLSTVPLSRGVATYATSSLTLGGRSITAVYGGDANFINVASSPLIENVEDFTVTASFPAGTLTPPPVLPGGSLTVNLLVTPTLGASFPSATALSATGLPTGATATFTPQTMAAGSSTDTATLTIHLANQIVSNTPGSPWGRGVALAMFGGIFLLPFAGRLRRPAGKMGRFVGLMLLLIAATGAALGLTACGGGGASGYFGQQQKNYTVTITAASGTLSHSTTVTFYVE